MLQNYMQALTSFGIKSGFVEEQIEGIYHSLIARYVPEEFEYLSEKYCVTRDKKQEIEQAYSWLCEPFSHYIVDSSSKAINEEQMIESIARLIHDNVKKGKQVEKHFIANLVELFVSGKGLHEYVKDIKFLPSCRNEAAYTRFNTLIVYENPFTSEFHTSLEKEYYPYYKIVSIVGHEIEHANQKREGKLGNSGIRSLLWYACDTNLRKEEEYFNKIVKFPNPFFFFLNVIGQIVGNINYRKYYRFWEYSPKERVADIYGNNLVLTLIEQSSNKEALQHIKNFFSEEIMGNLFSGYDKPLGPTDFYFSKFKQYEDCFRFFELSKELSLEERLLFGFFVTPSELESAKENKEKILSETCKIC